MLEGIRVVELSTEPGAALAGRLLAAYGADVVVVEPPEGHPLRALAPRAGASPDESILFAHLGAGKRSLRADLTSSADAALVRRLISTADVVLDSYAPGALAAHGLAPAKLIEEQPRLVVCSIAPFGQTGPRANWHMTALTSFAAGGQMALCGDADKPPLKTAGHQAHYQAGLHAFSATLTALVAAARTGLGDWIDLSVQEVQAATLEGALPAAMMNGTEANRSSNITFAQWGIHECKDGYIGLSAMPRQTHAVYDCIGHPELKEDPAFASGWSPEPNELLSALVPEWTAQYTDDEIFEIAAKYRTPFAMIPDARRLLNWPGLTEQGFWQWVEHPVLGRYPLPSGPIEFGQGDRGRAAPAPLLGEHTEEIRSALREQDAAPKPTSNGSSGPQLPLAGLRVIDMTAVWAGPYGTRHLADMGAEVIKVEGPSQADPVRTMAGARSVPEINQSHYFNEYNRNKLGISLDIKQPQGLEALRGLIATADVFIENWSSGVAERIGLGYEAVKAIKPDIVYVSMPGFGHHGPDSERIGFGPTIEQMGGLVALQGYEGGPPHRSGISYGDPIAGTIAAGAVAMGLWRREQTGESVYAVVPQRDAICSLVGEYVIAEALGHPLPTRIGSRDAEWAPHGVYPTTPSAPRPGALPGVEHTETWLAIAVDSEEAWRSFKRTLADSRLDAPEFATMELRHANQDRLDAVIAEWTQGREMYAAAAQLQAAGVAASPVISPLLMTRDEQMLAREAFLPYTHPATGSGRTVRPAWRMQRRPSTTARPAPCFGEHTAEVLTRVLGYTGEQIEQLQQRQVVTSDLIAGAAG